MARRAVGIREKTVKRLKEIGEKEDRSHTSVMIDIVTGKRPHLTESPVANGKKQSVSMRYDLYMAISSRAGDKSKSAFIEDVIYGLEPPLSEPIVGPNEPDRDTSPPDPIVHEEETKEEPTKERSRKLSKGTPAPEVESTEPDFSEFLSGVIGV